MRLNYRRNKFWQKVRAHWHRMGAAHLVLIISIIPTVIAYQRARSYAREKERERFEQLANVNRERLQQDILRHLEAVTHIRHLVATPGIAANTWADFLDRSAFFREYPALLQVAYLARSTNGAAGVTNAPWLPAEPPLRLILSEHRKGAQAMEAAFGADEREVIASLLNRADESSSIKVTDKCHLPPSGTNAAATVFLAATAVRPALEATNLNQPAAGFVLATLNLDTLAAEAGASARPGLKPRVLDSRELARADSFAPGGAGAGQSAVGISRFKLGDHEWGMTQPARLPASDAAAANLPWIVLGAGLTANLLLFGIAWMQASARLEAEALTEELRAVQERDRLLERATNDAIWDWDIGSRRMSWNEAMQTMFRFATKELQPTLDWWLDHLHPEDRRRVWNGKEMAVQTGGEFWADEYRFRRGDGSYASVIDRGFIIHDRQGVSVRMIGSIVDITSQKEAEAARLESERKLALHIQQTPVAVIEWDLDFKVTAWNPAAEKIFGYSAGESVGRPARELIVHDQQQDPNPFLFSNLLAGESLPTAAREQVKQIWRDILEEARRGSLAPSRSALADRSINAFGVANRSKNGSAVICDWYNTPLVDVTGQVVGIASLVLDVSARKQAEDDLAREKERLAVTLRSIGDGVVTTDTDGRINLINKMAEELTGWSQAEALGQPLERVFNVIDRSTRLPFRNPLAQVLAHGEIVDLPDPSMLVSRVTGEKLIAASAAPIHNQESRIIGAVLVFRDITDEQITTEERLRASKLDSLGILAGGIAHDFNNILTAVIGNISFARLFAQAGDQQYTRLEEAEKAAQRAKELATQLLTFSKGGSPVRQTASLGELIRDSTGFALRGSNVRCEFATAPDLWPVEVDQGQISQVINNLVINAIQAMPHGGILRVSAANVALDASSTLALPPGRYARITVRDSGSGIKPEHLAKVFDPYFTTKDKGTGLGLATSYSIVKRHDGLITVDSTPGKGAEFHIYLPASERTVPAPTTSAEAPMEGHGRILVMDDEEIIRELAITSLEFLGYRVDAVPDGQTCIEQFTRAREAGDPYSVVIMDLTIPGGMGGVEAIKALHEIDPKVKAIVSSGYSSGPVMANYQEHGFSGVVAKPYKIEDLAKALSNLIRNGS